MEEYVTVSIKQSEYEYVIRNREIEEFNKFSVEYGYRHFNYLDPECFDYKELIALKVKELDDCEEMVLAVIDDNLDLVKEIFERDGVKIPYPILGNANYYNGTGFGYELKYEKALDKACKLGKYEIIKYLLDQNITKDNIQNLSYDLRKGCKDRNEPENSYFINYLNIKTEEFEKNWKLTNQKIHFKSVPKPDPRESPYNKRDLPDIINRINIYKAVNNNDLTLVKHIFKHSKEEPRAIQGYKESHTDTSHCESLLLAVKSSQLDIVEYFLENKVECKHLKLLNQLNQVHVPGKFEYRNECGYILNKDIEYTSMEKYLMNCGFSHGIYYDEYDARNWEQNHGSINKRIEIIHEILVTYPTEELISNVDKLMQAVIKNDLPTIKKIMEIGPIKDIPWMSIWGSYTRMYKKCIEKAVDLKLSEVIMYMKIEGVDYDYPVYGS
jgi:hypothetical protein